MLVSTMAVNNSSPLKDVLYYMTSEYAAMSNGSVEQVGGGLFNYSGASYADAFTALSSTGEHPKSTPTTFFVQPPMDIVTKQLTDITNALRRYYTPSIISLGISGNILSTLLLLNTTLAALPASRYLAACAVVDCLYLVNLLVTWLVELGYPVFSVGALCHATTFVSKACSFLSVWYTVSYSVDALVVIKYPNAQRQLCTVLRAKLVCLVLAVVATAVFLNISLLVTVIDMPSRQVCIPLTSFQGVLKTLNELDVFVNFVLPSVACLYMLVSCMVQCYKDGRCERRGPHRPPQRSVHVECDVEAGVNRLYLTFTITSIVLTFPLNIVNAAFVISGMTDRPIIMTLRRYLVMEVARSLHHLKFASHLPVLLLAWTGFRSTLSLLVSRYCLCVFRCRSDSGNFPKTRYVDYSIEDSDIVLHNAAEKLTCVGSSL